MLEMIPPNIKKQMIENFYMDIGINDSVLLFQFRKRKMRETNAHLPLYTYLRTIWNLKVDTP